MLNESLRYPIIVLLFLATYLYEYISLEFLHHTIFWIIMFKFYLPLIRIKEVLKIHLFRQLIILYGRTKGEVFN
jgi:hypothetical protein